MKSKTKIEKQIRKKTNAELVETIISAKKNNNWLKVAEILSSPRSKKVNVNIERINKFSKEGEKIAIPGKVLSLGEMDKKIKIIALEFSEKAREKSLKAECEIS